MFALAVEAYSRSDSLVHRLDPRAKVLVALAYTGTVISVAPMDLLGLLPFVVLPAAWLSAGGVPWSWALRRVLAVSPLVLAFAAFNPVFDARPVAVLVGDSAWVLRAGWITAASILARFALTASCLTALAATTPFHAILAAFRRLGMPGALVLVLSFLYRYLFLLVDQVLRTRRAMAARGGAGRGWIRGLRTWSQLLGTVLVHALERAERVHAAMLARGFDGRIRTPRSRSGAGLDRLRFRLADGLALAGVVAYLAIARAWAELIR